MAKTIATSNSKPGAWIVSPNDKGRKSIKNGKVFLNDGDEFEIELFNPLTVSVLADIKLNGQSISKTGLVIKPGQRVYLDCFIDDRKKFKFSTYEIENSEEALDATQNNGLLEVFFYKEDVITLDNWKSKFDRIIVEKWYPVYYPSYPSYPYYKPSIWYGTTNPVYGGTITTNGSGIVGTTTTNTFYSSVNNAFDANGIFGKTGRWQPGIWQPIAMACKPNLSYTSNVDLNISGSNNNLKLNSLNSTETGRVEKGEKSSQKFTEVDMDFENHYIASTIIQILPESRKPAEVKTMKTKQSQLLSSDEVIELIKKLSELHSSGILTDEEFSEKKAELLSKI